MALHWFVRVLLCFFLSSAVTSSSYPSSSPSMNSKGCQRKCGTVDIPYPFGMGKDDPSCFRNQWFNITCDETATPPKALLMNGLGGELLEISLQGQLRIKTRVAWDCYSKLGSNQMDLGVNQMDPGVNQMDPGVNQMDLGRVMYSLPNSPHTFSTTRNKLTGIGCDTQAFVLGVTGNYLLSTGGCMSSCSETASVINGSCTGVGCCQSSIPAGLNVYGVKVKTFSNHTGVWSFSPCSYAFLVDKDFNLNFSVSNLSETNFLERIREVPMVFDWVAGTETCQEANRNRTEFEVLRNLTIDEYACRSDNSSCSYSTTGYRCSCSLGYKGNPYVIGGCQDIDECKDKKTNNCEQICINTPGSYSCKCRKGYHIDDGNDKTGCIADVKGFLVLTVTLGTGSSLLFLFVGSTWTYWIWRKRRIIKLKEKFFKQNGGLMLQQKICNRRGDAFKIFTIEELKSATNNYNASTIVGQGGYGIVYKGVLPNNQIIAIKKSKRVDAGQIEQFINELDILSQINHRNVVKVLGCCLEDQVPILVYEFVSNGTLYHHIHNTGFLRSISLDNRLKLAIEIAEALAYLHSTASIPIFHRDVKSANILLDDNFTTKVSDFGISRLVPIDPTHITTLVQGTWGYLDPECFQTGKLTDKSDVYSFGVLLLELLIGEKAVCLKRSEEERNLAIYFIHAMKENRLFQTLEDKVQRENSEELLMAIAQLVLRCLKLKGEKRPTMKEVVVDLQGLRGFQRHPWVNNNEIESLLCETSEGCIEDFGSGQSGTENNFLCVFHTGAQDMSLTLNR